MVDPVTPNKSFAIPIRGSDVGVWDVPINGDFTSIDSLLGGVQAVALSSTNVTLTQTQANNLLFNCTGALLADVEVIFPAIGGMFIISNQTTGAHAVTVLTSAVGSTGAVVAQGDTVLVYLDGTNASPAAPAANSFPSGTKLIFPQASAPSGWTQVTSLNDYAMRIVSGTGGAVHGSVGLSSFIAAGTQGHTLQISEMPSHNHGAYDNGHNHTLYIPGTGSAFGFAGGQEYYCPQGNPGTTWTASTGYANITVEYNGGSGSHNHPLYDLAYLDMIQCSKN